MYLNEVHSNRLKAKLKNGEAAFGTYVRHAEPGLSEILCYLGFDFLFIDSEHAGIEPRDCENLARVCELHNVMPVIRIPSNQPWMIGRYFDLGMQGVMVPMVNSAAEAEAVVRAAKFQPEGSRGLAGARAAGYAQAPGFHFGNYVREANAETLVVVQVETKESVEALPEIVKVPGIDVIFVGPTDLANSYGVPGEYTHPAVQAAFDYIAEVVRGSDKTLGVLATTVEATAEWRKRGALYISSVLESIMGAAVRDYLRAVRGL